MVTHEPKDYGEHPGNEDKKPAWVKHRKTLTEKEKEKKAPTFLVPKAYEILTKEECRRFEQDKVWFLTINSVWQLPPS